MAHTLLRSLMIAALLVAGGFCQNSTDTDSTVNAVTDPGDSVTASSTTASKTTPTDKPSNTTSKANTTTTSVTTMKPATSPKPEGTPVYELKGDDGKNCMVLKATISINITTSSNQTVTSAVPYNDPVNGTCGDTSTVMVLEFSAPLDNKTDVDMTLSLTVTVSSNVYQLSRVRVDVSGADNETFVSNVTDFKTSKGSTYKCADKQTVTAPNMEVDFTDLQLAAFHADISKDFKDLTVNDCNAAPNKTDAVVPIAVGCALAVMVLIVLIGYCIGRRRVRPGYQQMAE